MKYQEAKETLLKYGVKWLTEDEIKKIVGEFPLMIPCGCLRCGHAHSEDDFTEILYFLCENENIVDWVLDNSGEMVSLGDYSVIACCRKCGHTDLYRDF